MLREIVVRRSVRKYKKNKVSKENILTLIKAAQYAPNSKHNRAWEFLIIEDDLIKEKLYNVVGQDFVKEAPVIIIPVIDTKKTKYPIQDLSVASENILLQAVSLHLGAIWKNINDDWVKEVKKILNIPKQFKLINIIPVGYSAEKSLEHTETEFDLNKIHWGKW